VKKNGVYPRRKRGVKENSNGEPIALCKLTVTGTMGGNGTPICVTPEGRGKRTCRGSSGGGGKSTGNGRGTVIGTEWGGENDHCPGQGDIRVMNG